MGLTISKKDEDSIDILKIQLRHAQKRWYPNIQMEMTRIKQRRRRRGGWSETQIAIRSRRSEFLWQAYIIWLIAWRIWSEKCATVSLPAWLPSGDTDDKSAALRLRHRETGAILPRRSPRSRRPHYKETVRRRWLWRWGSGRCAEGRESDRTATLEHRFTRLPLFYDPTKCRSLAEHPSARIHVRVHTYVHTIYVSYISCIRARVDSQGRASVRSRSRIHMSAGL